MTNGHDPALDVRAELERAAAGVSPADDLLPAVHRRASRLRRRRATGGAIITLGVAAIVGAGALMPALASRPDATAAGSRSPSATADTTPAPPDDTAPTGRGPAGSPSTGPPSSRDPGDAAGPWGTVTVTDDFAGPQVDRTRWNVYDGPGDRLGRWSPSDVGVGDGALRLTVTRPGGDPPSRWGGVGALQSAQRYGRWETRLRMSAGRGVIGQFVLSAVPGTVADPSAVIVVSLSPYHGVLTVSGNGTGRGGPRSVRLAHPGDYHRVAVEWTPDRVRVLLDATTVAQWSDGRLPASLWPALQTIMAGPDCGAVPLPADCQGTTTTFPQRLDVDWIRVRAYGA